VLFRVGLCNVNRDIISVSLLIIPAVVRNLYSAEYATDAAGYTIGRSVVSSHPRTRAVRRRTGGRRRRWVVLWPASAARRAFFISGGVALWSAAAASAASDRMREH